MILEDICMNKDIKKKKRNSIPFRLNALFLAVFLAFSVLVLRLGVVQVIDGEDYAKAANAKKKQTTQLASPRGIITDSTGKVLVGNKAELAIAFIRKPNMQPDQILSIAKKLSKIIFVDEKRVTFRDKADYYLLTRFKKLDTAYKKYLKPSEIKQYSDSTDPKKQAIAYNLMAKRVTVDDVKSIKPEEMKVLAIKHELDQAQELTPHIVAKGLTEKQMATIGEHLDEFDGTIETTVDSTRTYPNGYAFYLGQVKDIPEEKIDGFEAKGYNRNDKVGVSYLESQYESYLRGLPTTLTFPMKNNKLVGAPKREEGSRGDDLQLTINMDLQKKVNSIVRNQLGKDGARNEAYAVVMNPKTGAILALGGAKRDGSGKIVDASSGTVGSQFQMGSAVKGATVLTGYQHNAVPSSIYDMPIKIKGTNPFRSWTTSIGTIDAEHALMKSSNVFMGTIAGNMAGFRITPAGGQYSARVPAVTEPRFRKAVEDLRQGYSEFGLGTRTGIDIPQSQEATGYSGGMPDNSGVIMYFSIGQFDTYTPLQLGQYVSTIANGGYRVAPHFLQSVHEPSQDGSKLGNTIYSYKTKVLNTIPNTKDQFDTVQHGFYLVTQPGGTASMLGLGSNAKYKIAAKTGTAQVNTNTGLENLTLASYAPYNNPEVAVAVVVPNVYSGHPNSAIALKIYQAYDDIYHYTNK